MGYYACEHGSSNDPCLEHFPGQPVMADDWPDTYAVPGDVPCFSCGGKGRVGDSQEACPVCSGYGTEKGKQMASLRDSSNLEAPPVGSLEVPADNGDV